MLEKHILPRREKTDDANQFGTLTHWWKETGEWQGCNNFPTPLTNKAEGHVKTLLKKIALSGMEDQRDRWWPPPNPDDYPSPTVGPLLGHEVTFAYNPFTSVLELFRGAREEADDWKKQWDPSQWVTGTIDWLAKRRGRWHVDDLKTGAWPVDVETSKQLRSYAIVPWLLDGAPDEWECDVSITQWPKYPLAAEPTRTWHVLTALDMREHLQDLAWALSNPQIVRPSDYESQDGKLPNCAGCECREPVPHVSGWITNFWYRTLPYCVPGIMKRINERGVLQTD